MIESTIGRPKGSKTNAAGLTSLRSTGREELEDLYAAGKSTREIGEIFKVSRTAVDNRFKTLGIDRRWYDEANSINNAKLAIGLSDLQRQLLLGSCLADACLHEYKKKTKNGETREYLKVQFAHGEAQASYLEHKRSVMLEGRSHLPRTCVSKIGQRPEGSNLGRPVSQFAFSHTPTLKSLCNKFDMKDAKRETRVSKTWVEALDAVAVAYWFLDDGCLLTYPDNGTWRFTLHTESESPEELEILLPFVRSFCAPSARLKRQREGQFVIESYRRSEVEELVRLIAPHTPECMLHKLKKINENI